MIYIVTGVSGGLGKAIVQRLLSNGEKVIGLGRSNSIESKNYTFFPCDFSKPIHWESCIPEPIEGELTLINNAGIIEPISRLVELSDESQVETMFMVNTISPLKLAMHVYRKMKEKSSFSLVNISSGAAKKSIPSWGLYCASKSALDRWTEAFKLEEWERGNQPKVYAVSPGVVDTQMQEKIRSVSQNTFSQVDRFHKLKQENQLYTPEKAAELILLLLSTPYSGEVFYDIREFSRST